MREKDCGPGITTGGNYIFDFNFLEVNICTGRLGLGCMNNRAVCCGRGRGCGQGTVGGGGGCGVQLRRPILGL